MDISVFTILVALLPVLVPVLATMMLFAFLMSAAVLVGGQPKAKDGASHR